MSGTGLSRSAAFEHRVGKSSRSAHVMSFGRRRLALTGIVLHPFRASFLSAVTLKQIMPAGVPAWRAALPEDPMPDEYNDIVIPQDTMHRDFGRRSISSSARRAARRSTSGVWQRRFITTS